MIRRVSATAWDTQRTAQLTGRDPRSRCPSWEDATVVDNYTGIGPNTSVRIYVLLFVASAAVALVSGMIVDRVMRDERISRVCGAGLGVSGLASRAHDRELGRLLKDHPA
jgi:hypothetical protein